MTKVIQTRQEDFDIAKKAHDDIVAANRGKPKSTHQSPPPIPEIIAPDKGIDSMDVNGTDVRYIDHDTGIATGWRRASEKAELDNDWAELG